MIYEVKGKQPVIHPDAYVHPQAVVIGDVTLAAGVSVWPGAVLRGDVAPIEIGENTNIQDGCVLHTRENMPLQVGCGVVVGHNVNLHSCMVEDGCLIGIGAIVLDGVHVAAGSIVAAGSLLAPGKQFPAGCMIMGAPAKVTRELRQEERAEIQRTAQTYRQEAQDYRQTQKQLD